MEGEDVEKWVLLCNINPGGPFGGSATQYFIGDFDGKTFRADLSADGSTATRWLDYGKGPLRHGELGATHPRGGAR